jgi:ABC-2 type transport system permease protein
MMRRILAIGWLNVQKILRDPSEMVGVVVLPLALTLVFGAAFGAQEAKPVQVPVADEDGSVYAEQVAELLAAEPSLEVTLVAREEAERRVREQETALAVVVPAGFGDDVEAGKATIRVLRDPASDAAFAAAAVVQGIAVRMSGNVAAAFAVEQMPVPAAAEPFAERYQAADARWEPEPPVGVSGETVIASEVRGDTEMAPTNTQYSTGFTIMFIMFVTFGGAAGILEEREEGTLRRLLIAPISKATIIGGKIFGIVITALLQSSILVGIGVALFKVPWGNDPLAVLLILVSYILAVTGLAVLLSAFVRSRDQYSGLGPVLTITLAMLGGSFWQLDIVSPAMQFIARLTPTGWAMIGLTDVVARNQGASAALVPMLVLLGFAIVSLGLGVKFLKFE